MKYRTVLLVALLGAMLGCTTPTQREPGPPLSGLQVEGPIPAAKAAIQAELSDGPGIAALFNKNYNEITSSCIQYGTGTVRGYYFCTGVLVRTVDNGDFNPWEASPSSIQLQGISFSWIRHDVISTQLYHRAGFVVLSPADAIASAVPGITAMDEIKCLYPLDAWTTRTMNRSRGGCDDEGTGLGWPSTIAWGSCEQRHSVTTAAQWDTYFRAKGQVNYLQCSWAADNPQAWRNMISSRPVFANRDWTEVMIRVANAPLWNSYMRNWVTAFFFDPSRSSAQADAQTFQRKLSATGKRVPILRLNLSNPATSRFQYVVSDQVAYP